jgi:putative transposase
MHEKWRRQVKSYIDSKVRQAVEWLYSVRVSIVKVGYPKNIAQEKGNFSNVHVWTYGYLLRKIYEVAGEYSTAVSFVDEKKPHQNARYMEIAAGKRLKAEKVFNTSGSCLQHSHNSES